jgi:hypothetical protein
MEATLGLSLYSYLYPKLAKMIRRSYYRFISFLFNKIGEKGRTGSVLELGAGVRCGGEVAQTMYTQVYIVHINVKTIK